MGVLAMSQEKLPYEWFLQGVPLRAGLQDLTLTAQILRN